MSKRDELNQLLKAHFYHESWHGFAALMVATAKEEALAEIRAERAAIVHEAVGRAWAEMIEELDARLAAPAPPPSGDVCVPAPASDRIAEQDIDTLYRIAKDPTATKGRLNFVPEKVQSREPAPGVDRITVSSQMGVILAAEATIDGKRYTMRGTPPPGARSVDLFHEEGGPAPVPCQEPFSWCACCGHPAKPGEPCPAQFDDTHIAIGDPYISCPPYTGGPSPSPDTAHAAEPPQAPAGLKSDQPDRLDALRWWLKANDDRAEIKRLQEALREIRDSPRQWRNVCGACVETHVQTLRNIASKALIGS